MDSDPVMRDNRIIKIKIQVNKVNYIKLLRRLLNYPLYGITISDIPKENARSKTNPSRYKTVILADSLALLPSSLDSLAKEFSSNFQKLYFPYNFVNNNTLFYIGDTPSYDFYKTEKTELPLFEYLKKVKNN